MSVTDTFIARPVATTLATLAIALAGGLAYFFLPVAPLPRVDFPTISVSASLPGASPETMAATVATPLERTLGRIAGISEMTSTSTVGNSRVSLQFDLSRDGDSAARDVQAAINAASGLLPSGMPSNPTWRKSNPADSPILIMAITSEVASPGEMYDVASTLIAQRLSQVDGVGNVSVSGSSLPAVRASMDLPALTRAGLTLEDVRTSIATANVNRPKGVIEDADRRWQVVASDQLSKADDYKPVIVRYKNGAALRLGDLGTVTDGVQDSFNYGTSNGRPSVSMVVFRQPGANIIEVVDRIKELMPHLRAMAPATMNFDITMERTVTIRASVADVQRSLLLSVLLVILVVFLFLRRFRTTLIPGVAVPVSLIGTFGVMYLFGYSLDNLSLMALTISTGFVVDDAVVVVENISRHIENGMDVKEAARRGAREVTFTVVSMSVSLVAVFIPILFMGGLLGRLFREFAVVLTTAIAVSLVISLTTTPMMCAHLLGGKKEGHQPGFFARWSDRAFGWVQSSYAKSLAVALNHRWIMLAVFLGVAGLTGWLYVQMPKGFFPQQDTGMLAGGITGDQTISFEAMRDKVAAIAAEVLRDPAVATVNASTGSGGYSSGARNSGSVFVSLKPASERDPVDKVLARFRAKLGNIPGATLFLQPGQDLRIGARSSQALYQYTLQAGDLGLLRQWEPRVRQTLLGLRELTDVNSDFQDKGELTRLVIDRDGASRLGVTMAAIDATLNDAFGQRLVSTIYAPLNQYRVVLEASRTKDTDDFAQVRVPTTAGGFVQLSEIARWESAPAPLAVNHQGQFAAMTFSFNLAPGVAFSHATGAINNAIAPLGLPESIQRQFAGSAGAFQSSLDSQPWLILLALVVIYLVLGILYESFMHPLTILSTLPSAGLGALLALAACGMEFSIMALIGIFLLIGIVKKNAIMMIDFALQTEREYGTSSRDAIFEACKLRLRPILMTSFAALIGALPLALGTGTGSELRRPLGVAVVGGLLVSQALTLYTTPVIYLLLDRLRLRFARGRRKPGNVPALPDSSLPHPL
jgi:multidrug efflux pump